MERETALLNNKKKISIIPKTLHIVKISFEKKVIGNIYRPPYSLNTFMMEFNSTLVEHHTNSQKVYYVW